MKTKNGKPCPPGEGGMMQYAKNVKMKKSKGAPEEAPAPAKGKMAPPFTKKGKRA
jgi:hypothetical protein